jgi:hypothetical protein
MSKLKAVVLEKNGTLLTVLSSDGMFKKLRHKGPVEVGEEIQISTANPVPVWRVGASVAAIFIMVFMGLFGWNAFQPQTAVAMLSVDINPSLQLTLDRKGRVLELESLNPDAVQLLAGLPLKGEPWREALSQIIEQSVKLHYLNSEHTWVVVGYSPIDSGRNLTTEEINSEEIAKQIDSAAKGIKPTVAVYELTNEEQVQAREIGLSLGEYALVNTAKKAGIQVKPEAVKKTDERVRLLEKPEIQEQMKKEKRIKREKPKDLPTTANPKASDSISSMGQEETAAREDQPSREPDENSNFENIKKSEENRVPTGQLDNSLAKWNWKWSWKWPNDYPKSKDKEQDKVKKSKDNKDDNEDEHKKASLNNGEKQTMSKTYRWIDVRIA